MTIPKRALISVSDKTALDDFARGLVELGFEILSTGGTRRFLEEAGVAVEEVSAYTGFPEIMGGRVKTLHPKIHAAILGRPDQEPDAAAIREHEIEPFGLVVCNLYPFEQTVAQPGVSVAEAIEQIDIGGPSMIRAAAKNHAYIAVVTLHSQYSQVLEAIAADSLDESFRRELAHAAFEMTARYDRAISDYFSRLDQADEESADEFPQHLSLEFHKRQKLRYGENPHQAAAFFVEPRSQPGTLASAEKRHGKELSYNNLLDLDAALSLVREFDQPAAAVLKHNNPCGCGIGDSLAQACRRGFEGDPVSAFGSIVGFNRPVDVATAEMLCEPGLFVEAIIAPEFDSAALEMLTTKPKWKANVRLLVCPEMTAPRRGLEYRQVTGGMLVQQRDEFPHAEDNWEVVTKRRPTEAEMIDLRFAWRVGKHVKSNAIVFAKEGMIVGVGAGQMSRLDSVRIAGEKAGERSAAAVLASDAFFPFRDGVDAAAAAGIRAVIQPGGSRRDEEVVAACNEHGMAMIFTDRRHFRH